MKKQETSFAALTEEFISRVAGRGLALKRDNFVKRPGMKKSYAWWNYLTDGKPAPLPIVEEYVRYAGEKGIAVEGSHVSCPRPLAPDEIRTQWKWDAALFLLSRLKRRAFSLTEGMLIPQSTAGSLIPLAAEMVVRCAGRMTTPLGSAHDHDACIERGEQLMRRSTKEYAEWLSRMHTRDPHTVMFAIGGGKGGTARAAACVMLPLSEHAMRLMMAGEIADYELTPEHIESPSPYLFVQASGMDHDLLEQYEKKCTKAQVHCLLYQAAYLSRGISPLSPIVVIPQTNPEFATRLEAQGYHELGTSMKGFNTPLVVLDGKEETESHYAIFLSILGCFRKQNNWPL